MRVSEDVRRQHVADLLMYVNAQAVDRPFRSVAGGRHDRVPPCHDLSRCRASAAQCEALLNLALEACEHYYPAFQFVLWGGKTAEEAVAAAVLECEGQA